MSRGFSSPAFAAFSLLFRPYRRYRLGGIHLAGIPAGLPADRPLLLVANHVSWWDAFLLLEIRDALRPRAPMHTVMLEAELRRHPYLRHIGVIGLDPARPAALKEVLRELRARLQERSDALVFFFPQGRIFPSHRRPLGFRRGVELVARALPPTTILPVGLHLEPMTSPAPHAWISVGDPIDAGEAPSSARLEAAVEGELDKLLDFLSHHGEDAADHWPPTSSGAVIASRTRARPSP